MLSGAKSLVPRAGRAELFVIAADAEGLGPALFVVESATTGVSIEAEPAMGLRAAATGRVLLEDARVPGERAARRRAPRRLPRSACSGRGSRGARSRSAPPRPCSTT